MTDRHPCTPGRRPDLPRPARRPLVAAVMAGILLAACSGGDDGDDPLREDALLTAGVGAVRAGLEQQIGHEVPSLSVLIETPGGAYFTSAAAPGAVVVTPDTRLRFASNTKTFAAASIMKMHQDGWLRYTDLVTAHMPGSTAPYLPDTPDWNLPYKSAITIRQLLQHSAGVFDVGNDAVPGSDCADTYEDCVLAREPDHQFTVEEQVAQAVRFGVSYFPPGTDHHYSNTGYAMLTEIVARVYSQRSGQTRSWADYVHDHLTGPQTPVPLPVRFPDSGTDQALPEPRVCGRVILPDAPAPVICDANVSAKVGEGNGIGSMRALNRWVRTVQTGRNVLSAETVATMRDDLSPGNPAYGLGTLRVENLGFGHNGATLGNLSLMLYDPAQNVSVVVYIPLWDLSDGRTSFLKVFNALECAGWRAREAFGYPGRPASAVCPG
ncbi:serine hydrolase [Pseudorhodoferax sp. Leaf267]|uniref:serine hydrolase domain-containing protein n=1 Tax=Pseudorhodoferax sp. Leaf267 TaxID=1736316 RepID=UPI00138F3190|nr:serine hydrolase domain-containing protein [Pseudorhodoferax sp. Leaf267]